MKIFDIGANAGLYTEANLSLNPSCEFVLVEANPELCTKLVNKFKDKPNITVLNSCASDTSGKLIDFYVSEADTISSASKDWVSSSRFSNMSFNKTITVESVSIESLVSVYGQPDHIKIDVEGYEKTVIKGMSKNLGNLSFEWAEESKPDILESVSHLFSIGYTGFCVTEKDCYTFTPSNYNGYDDTMLLLSELDPSRKTRWGMVFAR
tara:strand:+ start:196 stop:819 length:624 start_codon:yes stop_codon:yes gene_type:complete